MNTLVQKALSAGITLVGGIVGSRVVAGGWRLVTGHSAPDDAADETLPPVSYTHLTLPTTLHECRSRWSPYH